MVVKKNFIIFVKKSHLSSGIKSAFLGGEFRGLYAIVDTRCWILDAGWWEMDDGRQRTEDA